MHLVASELADRGFAKSATPDSVHKVGENSREEMHRQLSGMLLSAVGNGDQGNELFVDYLALALRALAVGSVDRNSRGGLASWQERKAKLLMSKRLDESVPMQQIATACGISMAHFARAFKQSTGLPPHRWLMERRLEQAKSLLLRSDLPLIEIAHTCGFAGQSHFTRIFTKRVGTSPGVWRRKLGRATARPPAAAMHEEFRDRHATHPARLLADCELSPRRSQRA
ncbi:MAG: AraC family transcriptional regulator [Rhodanobacter sp.]